MKKVFIFLILISLILILYFFTPVRHHLSKEGFEIVQEWIKGQGLLAPFVFGAIYVLATIFFLPGSVLTLGGGLIFGVGWGTVINLLSATLGACASFLIGRYLGRNAIQKLLKGKQKLEGLDEKIKKHGFYSVFFLRVVPLFPFNALNYGLGLTKVSFKTYALATLIGMLPGCFVYTSLGAVGRHVSFTDPHTWADYRVWGAFCPRNSSFPDSKICENAKDRVRFSFSPHFSPLVF